MQEILPVFTFEGKTSYELGFNYGKLLGDRIKNTWEIYYKFFIDHGGTPTFIKAFSLKVKSVIKKYLYDTIYQELKGISDGSNIDLWKIYAINSRTEIYNELKIILNECSSIIYKNKNIIGQNWDWIESMQSNMFIGRFILNKINKYNSNKNKTNVILSLLEPGMIGKIGLNSNKIGTLLMLLKPQKYIDINKDIIGIPIHILLRLFLESNNINYIFNNILNGKLPINTYSCIGLSNNLNKSYFIEFCGEKYDKLIASNNLFSLHTNHYLGCQLGLTLMEYKDSSTFNRLNMLYKLTDNINYNEINYIQFIKNILKNIDDKKYPICRYNETHLKGVTIGTNCSVILDLRNGNMHISKGNPRKSEFKVVNVNSKLVSKL